MRRGRFTPRSAADKLPATDVVKMQAAVSKYGIAGGLYHRLQAAEMRATMQNPFDLGVMASPPTITGTQANPSPRRETGYWAANGKSQFGIVGVTDMTTNFIAPYGTHYIGIQGCRTAAATYQSNGCTSWVEFVTDAPAFAFEFFEGVSSPLYMAVGTPTMTDMRLTNLSGHAASASPGGFTVDWGGVRKLRGYRIYLFAAQRLGRVSIGADDTLYRPCNVRPRVLDIGDSITISTMSPTAHGYFGPVNVAREVSGCDVVGHGIGGSGWIAGNKLANSWRIEDATSAYAYGLDLIRIHLGINDKGQTQAAVKAAAMEALGLLRNAVGNTPIEVKGPYGGASNADSASLLVEAGLQEAVTAMTDPLMIYTPTITASDLVWPETLGTNDTDTTGGVSGNSRYVTGNDNIHPSIFGAEYYGRRRWATTLEAVRRAGW